MLQADKQVLLAGVKRNALELRQRELEFHVERYTNLATQASVVAGFSFESLVELEVPEGTHPLLSACYFTCGASAMALALYVLCVASFACVFGHRLALQGPHGSLERAVHILIDHRVHIFTMAALSLVFLVGAAVLMAWIKMGAAASLVSMIFFFFAWAVYKRMRAMFEIFHIPEDKLVTGATRVHDPSSSGAVVDLSRLNPASRGAQTVPQRQHPVQPSRAGTYSRLVEQQADAEAAAAQPGALQRLGTNIGQALAAPFGGSLRSEVASSGPKHEAWLFKRGERGFFGTDKFQRRYFVLQSPCLYYYRSWEDFGAQTGTMNERLRAAVNHGSPINMRQYAPRHSRLATAASSQPPRHNRLTTAAWPRHAHKPAQPAPAASRLHTLLAAPRYDIVRVRDNEVEMPNRFDLVPTNPLDRKFELQGVTADETDDWINVLRLAKGSDADPGSSSAATVIVQN